MITSDVGLTSASGAAFCCERRAFGPLAHLATVQQRAFSVVGPSVWNDLPIELPSLLMAHPSKFHVILKSFFFGCDLAGSASE